MKQIENAAAKAPFLPDEFKSKKKIEEMSGIYLPYWTFDADTFSSYNGEYGIDKTKRKANGEVYTQTNWYKTSGTYSEFIDDELIFAGKN